MIKLGYWVLLGLIFFLSSCFLREAGAQNLLSEEIQKHNSQNQPFFIAGCSVADDKYIGNNLFPILIVDDTNGEFTEGLFLVDAKGDTVAIADAEWGHEFTKGSIFEAQGGVWSYIFAFEIYDYLRNLPFVRRMETSKEDLIKIASERTCQIDHSALDAYSNQSPEEPKK